MAKFASHFLRSKAVVACCCAGGMVFARVTAPPPGALPDMMSVTDEGDSVSVEPPGEYVGSEPDALLELGNTEEELEKIANAVAHNVTGWKPPMPWMVAQVNRITTDKVAKVVDLAKTVTAVDIFKVLNLAEKRKGVKLDEDSIAKVVDIDDIAKVVDVAKVVGVDNILDIIDTALLLKAAGWTKTVENLAIIGRIVDFARVATLVKNLPWCDTCLEHGKTGAKSLKELMPTLAIESLTSNLVCRQYTSDTACTNAHPGPPNKCDDANRDEYCIRIGWR